MRLSDLMSSFGLAGFAEIGLIIFFFVFLAVMFRALSPKHQAEYEAASYMPLDDDLIRTPRQGGEQAAAVSVTAAGDAAAPKSTTQSAKGEP
jgi:cbb3-type cytochrome oxidase subunit 3